MFLGMWLLDLVAFREIVYPCVCDSVLWFLSPVSTFVETGLRCEWEISFSMEGGLFLSKNILKAKLTQKSFPY